jgi:hypothetical protein
MHTEYVNINITNNLSCKTYCMYQRALCDVRQRIKDLKKHYCMQQNKLRHDIAINDFVINNSNQTINKILLMYSNGSMETFEAAYQKVMHYAQLNDYIEPLVWSRPTSVHSDFLPLELKVDHIFHELKYEEFSEKFSKHLFWFDPKVKGDIGSEILTYNRDILQILADKQLIQNPSSYTPDNSGLYVIRVSTYGVSENAQPGLLDFNIIINIFGSSSTQSTGIIKQSEFKQYNADKWFNKYKNLIRKASSMQQVTDALSISKTYRNSLDPGSSEQGDLIELNDLEIQHIISIQQVFNEINLDVETDLRPKKQPDKYMIEWFQKTRKILHDLIKEIDTKSQYIHTKINNIDEQTAKLRIVLLVLAEITETNVAVNDSVNTIAQALDQSICNLVI